MEEDSVKPRPEAQQGPGDSLGAADALVNRSRRQESRLMSSSTRLAAAAAGDPTTACAAGDVALTPTPLCDGSTTG
jgi:hypothetical protein